MASEADVEITHDFPPFFKVYENGRIERYGLPQRVPPTVDSTSPVQSKDVLISPDSGVEARIFFPKVRDDRDGQKKLPLILHFHGGGFCVGSPFDPITRSNLTSLVNAANAIAVSVDYRLAPEHPLPLAYHDSYAALHWIAAHSNGQGPEPVLNERADFGRVFLAGESAGANIAHHVAVRAGKSGSGGLKLLGSILVHPFFGGTERDKLYKYIGGGDGDPNLYPEVDPNVSVMGCDRVLVRIGEKDRLKERGRAYYETIKKSGWVGSVELEEDEGADHCFHLFNPTSEEALALTRKLATYVNRV